MKEELLWEKVLKRIKEEVNSLVYASWFEPTKLRIVDDNKYVIIVPLEIQKKHLQDRYYDFILNNLLKETKKVDELSFILEKEFEDDEEDLDYVPKHGVI